MLFYLGLRKNWLTPNLFSYTKRITMQSLKQCIFTVVLFLVSNNIHVQNNFKNVMLNEIEGKIYSFEQNQSSLNPPTSFIKDVSLNRDYRITNSEEILALIQSEYKTSPKEIKKKCIKTLQCREYSIFEEGGLEMFAQTVGAVFTNGKAKHPHLCSCNNWTIEYKNKVACHKCKDERVRYCGQNFNCFTCNGKGYTIEEEEGEKNLSLNEFLDSEYEIEKTDFFIYYNSPTDFGYLSGMNKINLAVGSFNILRIREIYDENSIKCIAIKKPNHINKELSQFSELINEIETKIPDQILEASELWVENENILFPLNSSRQNILDRIEKGLINHFSQDTININVISSSSIDNDFLKSLKQGKHSIKGNLNENGDYPFSEDFKKEIRQKSLIKGKAVDVYKPFRLDFIVEVRDSILVNTEYSIGQPTTLGEINMNKQERIYNKNGFSGEYIYIKGENLKNPNYYYKSKSGLKTVQANWEKNVPKDVIIIKSTFKNEKWLNNAFKIQEKNFIVVEQQIIMKKEM